MKNSWEAEFEMLHQINRPSKFGYVREKFLGGGLYSGRFRLESWIFFVYEKSLVGLSLIKN